MKNDQLYKSIFPIIQYEKNGHVSIAGTSVLVEHKEASFLVTAAHVLRKNGDENPLYLLLDDKNVEMIGPALMSSSNGTDLDLAIFDLRLNRNLMSELNGYKTISLEEPYILPDHSRSHFLIFGFPWRKASYHKKTSSIRVTPLSYITNEADDNVYKRYSRSKENFKIVQYKQKNTIDQLKNKTTAPYPHGASGGPLLRLLVDENDYGILFTLEGILLKWEDKEFIISAKRSALKKFIENVV